MKSAAVHCRLFPGGALEVFKDLLQQELRNDPEAEIKIFTMIADSDLRYLMIQIPGAEKYRKIQVVEALPKWLSRLFLFCGKKHIPILSSIFDYRNLIVFYPEVMKILSKKIKKFWPERMVISSYAIAKNVKIPQTCKYTKLYLHSPMQYIWSHREEYVWKFKWWKKKLFKSVIPRLQKWDKHFTEFDEIIFNSNYTAWLAEEIYWMMWKVKYPKIKDYFYLSTPTKEVQNYFVCVGRVVNFAREVWLIIKACNETNTNLLIIWSWPDEIQLKALAWDTVIFLWWLPQEESLKIIRNAKWLINLTKESFWMWTAEALLLWVPVIWFAQWWSKELVDENSWILIDKKSISSLKDAIQTFEDKERDRRKISDTIREKLQKYS